MKTGNTQSPSRQSATTPGGPGRLGKSIVAGLMAALILAIFLAPGLQGTPTAEAQTNNAATGTPGIRDAANPNDSLTTVRPGMTLIAETTSIMDDDGITNPNWMYQWAHWDGTNDTDITGATAITYLVEEKDIGKAMIVKVSFTDDLANPEGPIESAQTRFVGPKNLIVSNKGGDPAELTSIALTTSTPKGSQSFVSSASMTTNDYTLDFIEITFSNISDTANAGDGITVTLNADSSGDPGSTLCTLENPETFSSSGPHNFYAPSTAISDLCPLLEANNTYHVVIERNSTYTGAISITYPLNKITDIGSASGWTIPNASKFYSSSAWADHAFGSPILIDIRARPNFELAELTETEVPFGWSLTPEGTTAGQKFRLMFLTDDEKPTSTDINVYNEFVQAQAAAGHADIQEHANQFRVLGSTADDDARDNTETTSSDTDAPIYWLNGAKVADNYADLYDETWHEETNRRTSAGDLSTDSDIVWTGSDDDGTERQETGVSVALGETSVRQGELDNSSSTLDPLSAVTVTAATNTAPFYALSGIFVVEPNNEATGTLNPKTKGPRVDDVLYIEGRGTIDDPEGITNAEYTLQWKRYDPATGTETDIEGGTGEPYRVRTTDAEHQLRFSISFTDDHNNQEVILSEYTPPVVPADVLVRIEYDHDLVDSPLNSTNESYGQKFNTGHEANGYTIDSIGFYFAQIDAPSTADQHLRVTLNKDDQGTPAGTLCRLKAPASFSAPGMNYFTSPEATFRCPTLERNTDYHVVIHRAVTTTDVIAISTTTEDDEANGSQKNWTIEDTGQVYTQNAWANIPASRIAVIEVKGTQAREITIPVDSPIIPEGLEGSRFRLMFVSVTTAATERNMFQYNQNLHDLINDAREVPGVRDLEDTGTSHMAVLASTADIDARDSTYTTYTSTDKGVPIFWYNGAILADDYEDLYDGTWQNEDKPRNYDGTLVTDLTKEYWTGSDSDGTAKTRGGVSKALAQTEVETGILNHATGDPLSHAADDPTESKSMYALTGIYIIENHEATGLPSITGIPRVGETLTADTSAITDGNGTDKATFTYRWSKVDGDSIFSIAGATSKTYTPTADVAGKPIALDVTMTDNHGYNTPFLSSQIDPTEPIQPTDLIVKNDELGAAQGIDIGQGARYAQGFTATADADAYTVNHVDIGFHTVDNPATAGNDLTVTLNEESGGFPGAEICTLSNPSSITSSSMIRFQSPDSDPCQPLTPGATYFVVVSRPTTTTGDIDLQRISESGQHPGSAPGWSIDYRGDSFNQAMQTWVQSLFDIHLVIDIRGEVATEITAPANWPLTPTGLIGGDKFRLLFITYTGHSSANTDIENYNAYVKSQANAGNAHAAIKPYSYWFRVLGSTEDVSARDNTMTTGTGVPIYWMGGDKVADNYGDFYDGSWDSEMSSGRAGIPSSGAYALWTGTENNGTRASANGVYQTLGTASVRIGSLNGSGDPLSALNTTPGTNYHYYALSGIFIAPNTDATGQPAITGTPRVNETLSVDTSGITDPEGTNNARYTYQWVRVDGSVDAEISGATRSTYRPTEDDADKQIKVKVSFTDDHGFAEGPLESELTDPIVAADVLLKNTGQTPFQFSSSLDSDFTTDAQAFTTGADTGGYNLDSISILFDNISSTSTAGSDLTVTLNEVTGLNPDTTLCTLVDPPAFASSGVHTFTIPTTGVLCPTLQASTKYYVVMTRVNFSSSAIDPSTTESLDPDPGSAPGWSIDQTRYFDATGTGTWLGTSVARMIEVRGTPVLQTIESDHRTWVENRRGDAATEYENTGDFTIAQGFRTGGTAGVYKIHEISIDFDRGQPDPAAIRVRIVESSSLKTVDDEAIPTTYWKGGNFPARRIGAEDGTHTFTLSLTQVIGYSILDANTNYFITIESTSTDSSTAAVVRMTETHNQTTEDGWAVDNHVYV